jgi:F420-non-reducing hydrogenase iron-sulfur subunit
MTTGIGLEKVMKPKITVMYCINCFAEKASYHVKMGDGLELKFIKLPCSSMVKDVFVLRAFEAGSDAVVIFVCPEGQCRYVEGNMRAGKRVAWLQNLLDEIGLDGRRLILKNVSIKDETSAENTLQGAWKLMDELGLSPAR